MSNETDTLMMNWKDLEGSNRGIIEGSIRAFAWSLRKTS
jgi:hypothetical protein